MQGGGTSSTGTGIVLTPDQQAILDELAINDTVYFGDDPANPINGDGRLIKANTIVTGERYEAGTWMVKSTVISNSLYTDRFVAEGILTGFLDHNTSLIRTGRFSDTVVVGEATSNLRLNGCGDVEYTESNGVRNEWTPQPLDTMEISTDTMEFWTTPSEYEMVIQNVFYFNTLISPDHVYIRWTAHTDPLKTEDSLVYESASAFDVQWAKDNNLEDHKVYTADGIFDYSNKPLYLKDMEGAKMYYTIYLSEVCSVYGAEFETAGEMQFYPKNDQWDYKSEQKWVATKDWVEDQPKDLDVTITTGIPGTVDHIPLNGDFLTGYTNEGFTVSAEDTVGSDWDIKNVFRNDIVTNGWCPGEDLTSAVTIEFPEARRISEITFRGIRPAGNAVGDYIGAYRGFTGLLLAGSDNGITKFPFFIHLDRVELGDVTTTVTVDSVVPYKYISVVPTGVTNSYGGFESIQFKVYDNEESTTETTAVHGNLMPETFEETDILSAKLINDLVKDTSFKGSYDIDKGYNENDIVVYKGQLYRAHTVINPISTPSIDFNVGDRLLDDNQLWQNVSGFKKEYYQECDYTVDDLVLHDGKLWVCLNDVPSGTVFSTTDWGSVSSGRDSGWLNLAFSNGWVNFGSTWRDCQYRKIGSRVYMEGLVRGSGSTVIGTLPEGFRPPEDVILTVLDTNYDTIAVIVSSDGEITPRSAIVDWASFSFDFFTD